MIVLLVMTDGRRECIEQTIPSALAHLHGPISRRVIHDDSGDDTYRRWLELTFPTFDVVGHPAGRQGFGGAIRNAWRSVVAGAEELVFHLEDDFTFTRDVDLLAMARVLEGRPYLVQLALRRQPWNPDERAAGGIVEQHPADYVDWADVLENRWLEHRRFFTTNPSLYRRELCHRDWPDSPHSEGLFGAELATDPDVRFGFWGARHSGEWVHHIGRQRVGSGY